MTVSDERAFHFRKLDAGSTRIAHSSTELCAALETVPLASLAHHLRMGDFSRWASEVLGDAALTSSFRELELAALAGRRTTSCGTSASATCSDAGPFRSLPTSRVSLSHPCERRAD